jgi:Tol biopolymer transport system component/DNA-binding winged helix-turn-helix (wHTH) protein
LNNLENNTGIWRFGVFEVDARSLELRRNGDTVRIREQSFRILVHLLDHAGELVTREDLRRVLWPADTFVDFDHSLNTAMMKLRDALGDIADAPVYIETVPKRGYRFIAPVTQPAHPSARPIPSTLAQPTTVDDTFVTPLLATPSLTTRLSERRSLFAIGLLLFVVIALVTFLLFRTRILSNFADAHDREILRTLPLTSAAGDAFFPVFSPDGREISFVWDGSDRKGYDLYVQLIGAELPLRLTYHQGGLIGPASWSPDGREIAFQRCDGKNDGVFAVPALGGEERQLTSTTCYYTIPNPLAWINNGNEILMVDRCTPNGRFGVVDHTLATGQKRCLTDAPDDENDDTGYGFALSPDGSSIAFGRMTASVCCDIDIVPMNGGAMKRITSDSHTGCNTLSEFGCSGIMWTPNGKSVIFVTARSSMPALFRASVRGGASERETTYPAIGSFTRDGARFVYSQNTSSDPPAVWRADLANPGGSLRNKNKIITSQFPEMDAQPSPDGTRVVWMSMRTGSEEIFVSDSAGHDQKQLTHLDRYSGTPRWSPDGKWIAFDSYIPSKRVEIFLVEADGRNLHSVISAPFDCAVPSWSRDGKSIYYSANRGGVWQVWKHSLGSDANIQLTTKGGFNPIESTDGKTLFYTRFYEAGIWKISAGGGPESQLVHNRPQLGFWGHYGVSNTGLYFLDNDAAPHPTVDFYNFETQRISPVLMLDQHPARLQPSLSATADGKTIYFTQYDRQSIIKMLEFAPQ